MKFNLKNLDAIKSTIAKKTADGGKALLQTIKDAIDNQADGQSEDYSDEIYVLADCITWFSSGEGEPDEPHYTIEFSLVAPFASVGTITFTE